MWKGQLRCLNADAKGSPARHSKDLVHLVGQSKLQSKFEKPWQLF